jgi:polyphosphate kinase
LPARIILKLNNLEERVLIEKLYDASNAGVQIDLIVRSICCLVPGVPGMSENITVQRIVDRYLEHGRVYIFHNNGVNDVFLGSADWMNRNIYKRIEVCFPVHQEHLKNEILEMINIQLKDNVQAVLIGRDSQNVPVSVQDSAVQSQIAIYQMLSEKVSEVRS